VWRDRDVLHDPGFHTQLLDDRPVLTLNREGHRPVMPAMEAEIAVNRRTLAMDVVHANAGSYRPKGPAGRPERFAHSDWGEGMSNENDVLVVGWLEDRRGCQAGR
jgi:hypothetical protein